MTRFKPVLFAAGMLLALAGVEWHLDALVWAGIGLLSAVVVLRFVKRRDSGSEA